MTSEFHPIDIFRVPATVFVEKMQPCPESPDIISHLSTNENFFEKGMLYFYFSHNMFWAQDKIWSNIKYDVFSLEELSKFKQFIEQNYPNDRIFETLKKSYFKPKNFPFSGVKGIENNSKRYSKIMIVNSQGLISVCSHDYGIAEDIRYEHYYLLELIVRIIGEKVDRGYDPLCEIVAAGLSDVECVSKDVIHKNPWSFFLTQELYDPRLLLLIRSFEWMET